MPHTSPETVAHGDSNAPLVVVLLGPTASGKTALALQLAEQFELEIINVDSRQLYREMSVGTAKPNPEQQARIRHHLLDLRDPDQPITVESASYKTAYLL